MTENRSTGGSVVTAAGWRQLVLLLVGGFLLGLAILSLSLIAAEQSGPASTPAGEGPTVRIRLQNMIELTGNIEGADAQGFGFCMKYGTKHYAWTDIDTNYLKQVSTPVYDLMVLLQKNPPAASPAPAPAKPASNLSRPGIITIRLLDGTEVTGTASMPDARGFSFRTKYASSIHYNWKQIDTNQLKQVDADLYAAMVEKIREAKLHPTSGGIVTVRFRDGSETEGVITTSPSDTLGFTMRGDHGSVHYEWSQLDLNHLYENNPVLYQCMRQMLAVDQIVTDRQIVEFLSGKFTFRSDTNKSLKSYSKILSQLQGIARSNSSSASNKGLSQRIQQLNAIVNDEANRAVLTAFVAKLQQLRTGNLALQNLIHHYNMAFESLLHNDPERFLTAYAYCVESISSF